MDDNTKSHVIDHLGRALGALDKAAVELSTEGADLYEKIRDQREELTFILADLRSTPTGENHVHSDLGGCDPCSHS